MTSPTLGNGSSPFFSILSTLNCCFEQVKVHFQFTKTCFKPNSEILNQHESLKLCLISQITADFEKNMHFEWGCSKGFLLSFFLLHF